MPPPFSSLSSPHQVITFLVLPHGHTPFIIRAQVAVGTHGSTAVLETPLIPPRTGQGCPGSPAPSEPVNWSHGFSQAALSKHFFSCQHRRHLDAAQPLSYAIAEKAVAFTAAEAVWALSHWTRLVASARLRFSCHPLVLQRHQHLNTPALPCCATRRLEPEPERVSPTMGNQAQPLNHYQSTRTALGRPAEPLKKTRQHVLKFSKLLNLNSKSYLSPI